MTPWEDSILPTATEIADEIRIMSSQKRGPFLLVEGSSDVTFFSQCMTVDIANIIPSFGWETLFAAMLMLQSDGLDNVLGVIDLDYRGVASTSSLPKDIVSTDAHDLEAMMFFSPAFARVLKQKSSAEKVKRYGSDYAAGMKKVRRTVLRHGRLTGTIRLYSQLRARNYSFKRMKIEKFVDKRTMSLSETKLVSHLCGIHTSNKSITSSTIKDAVAEVAKLPIYHKLSLLCCGHDLMEIMAIGLRSLWGSNDSKEVSGDILEGLFMLAYPRDTFRGTRLFKQMDDWFKSKGYAPVWC